MRSDIETEEFDPLESIKATSDMTLVPGDNDVALKNFTTVRRPGSRGSVTMQGNDYKSLKIRVEFSTGIAIRGKMLLQIDIDLVSQAAVLGSNLIPRMLSTGSIVPLAQPLVRALTQIKPNVDWDFDRSWRMWVPVAVKQLNPELHFNLEVYTEPTLPSQADRLTIDCTCVVQAINSVIRYLGYGQVSESGEDDEFPDWEEI